MDYKDLPPNLKLGNQPIDKAYRALMQDVAASLDNFFNPSRIPGRPETKSTGFILLVFPFGDKEGRCNYISNGADRKDVVKMLKEQIARFEGEEG